MDWIEDFAQEALIRILNTYRGFRGDCSFATWVAAISIRVAQGELRRSSWKVRPLDDATQSQLASEGNLQDDACLEILKRNLEAAIQANLSARQREVIRAELAGRSSDDIARDWGTSRGAIYKATHDARLKLRRALERKGWKEKYVQETLDRKI